MKTIIKKHTTAVIIGLLVLVTGVLVAVNIHTSRLQRENPEKARISVFSESGEETYIFHDTLEIAGLTAFEAEMKRQVGEPIAHRYRGALMYDVLKTVGITLDPFKKVTLTCADNYAITLTADEVLEPNNVYIVCETDGEPLENGDGYGPFMIVVRKDPGSARWARQLVMIELSAP